MTVYGIKTIQRKINNWMLIAAMFGCSIILLGIGVPRFFAELMLVPGTPIYERIATAESISSEELAVLEKSRLQALEYVELPRAYIELGTIYLLRAQRGVGDDRTEYARRSVEMTKKGLALAPLNSFAWLRLSAGGVLLGRDHFEEAIDAWRTSIETANYEPFFFIERVHIGVVLYDAMGPLESSLLKEQIKLTYEWNREKLGAYAKKHTLIDWLIYLSADDPGMSAYFTKHRN